jgi:hypothetical protein
MNIEERHNGDRGRDLELNVVSKADQHFWDLSSMRYGLVGVGLKNWAKRQHHDHLIDWDAGNRKWV